MIAMEIRKIARLIKAFSKAIHLTEIPAEYKKYPVIARGNTSLILEKDPETVIMLTRDAMKKDWLDIGIEITKDWKFHDILAKNRKFNEFGIYAIEMPKLYKLDAANTKLVNKELKFFEAAARVIKPGFIQRWDDKLINQLAYHYEVNNKEDSIFYKLIQFLRNYDTSQWVWDLGRRQFAQDTEGNIVLIDPIVSRDLVNVMQDIQRF
jgi:hypothetical protein